MSPVRPAPFPHAGGCAGCRKARQCNGCGEKLLGDRNRCTNGRCARCHTAYCVQVGSPDRPHGLGDVGGGPHVLEVGP